MRFSIFCVLHLFSDKCLRNPSDEFSPCQSCIEAKAQCTHNSIPQKRGPRPRERPGLNTHLEQRLAQLEHLLASIPHNAGALAGLSEEEKREVQRAAAFGSPSSHSSSTLFGENPIGSTPMQTLDHSNMNAIGSGSGIGMRETGGNYMPPQPYINQALPAPYDYQSRQTGFINPEQQFRAAPQPPTFPPSAVSHSPNEQSPPSMHGSSTAPAVSSRRNLIYRLVLT